MRTAVFFKTHKWNILDKVRFLSLCDDLGDRPGYTATALYDGRIDDVPSEVRERGNVVCFDRAELLSLCKDRIYHPRSHRESNNPETSAAQSLLPLLWFSKSLKADRYWQVEPDVVYTGNWNDFFDVFENSSSHLIATHVHYEKERIAQWVNKNLAYEGVFDNKTRPYTSLNCVCRVSETLVKSLLAGYAMGMVGHFEAVVATRCAQMFGEDSLEDISDGHFCREENRHRFYRASANGRSLGSFGWPRKTAEELCNLENGHLYHSCKRLTKYEMENRFDIFWKVVKPHIDEAAKPPL